MVNNKNNLVDELLKKYVGENETLHNSGSNISSKKRSRFDCFVEALQHNDSNERRYYRDGYEAALNRYMDKAQLNRNNLQIVEKILKQELSQYRKTAEPSLYSQGYMDGLRMLDKALQKSKKEMMELINDTIMDALK